MAQDSGDVEHARGRLPLALCRDPQRHVFTGSLALFKALPRPGGMAHSVRQSTEKTSMR